MKRSSGIRVSFGRRDMKKLLSTTQRVLEPGQIGRVQLKNRLSVAPMTRVSAMADGTPTARMVEYYRAFAAGGFGLIVTEGTYPDDRSSQGYFNQPGIVTRSHVDGWRRITDAVHEADGVIFLQIMHAGALSQCNRATIAPSAVKPLGTKMPEYGGTGEFPIPNAMSKLDLQQTVESFANAASRAEVARFDGIEIHGANGYLLDQFLTTYTNQRTDEYGGKVGNRVRFLFEVAQAVRDSVSSGFVVGIRVSQTKVNDLHYRWPDGKEDCEVIFPRLAAAGIDYFHVASQGRDWLETATITEGLTITKLARQLTGVPVIANGGMNELALAEMVVGCGHADIVSLGRGALANPDWPNRLRNSKPFSRFDHSMIQPKATIENTDAWLAS
jgi:2,4-dienoyl-CoA reductase-like NADH-dependent reductase (Old Yellow Enzyme family)